MGQGTTNIAAGNARVGVQAGQIIGNVEVAPDAGPPVGLVIQIAGFRELLRRAHLAGHLDESTYQAAEAELDVVSDSLASAAEQDTSRLMVALKRLRGLIADVTELAAKLAAIISAVRGWS